MACDSEDGHLLTWGSGADGQLGHGGEWAWGTPRPVDVLSTHRVVSVACGGGHTAAVTGMLFLPALLSR